MANMIDQFAESIMDGPTQYPLEIDRLPGHVLFQVVDESDFPQSTIQMPLPPSLNHSDAATYDEADLGVFSAIGDLGFGGAADRAKSVIQNLDKAGAAQLTKDLTTKILGGKTEYATKTTPNPNTRSLFKKVGLRQFSFDYVMIPTSEKEGDMIQKIIKKFRGELYPESTMAIVQETVKGVTREESYLAYKYPNRFKIKFFLSGQEIEPKIYPCYLQSVNVAYNTSGILRAPAMSPSTPVGAHFSEYRLSLKFIESTTLFKADVLDEFDGGY